jgi:hypothetical protein
MRVDDEFPPAPQWMCDIWDEFREAMKSPEWRDVPMPPLPPMPVSQRRETPRQRKQDIGKMITAAERSGKNVTSITTPDGVTLHFGKGESTEASNPWLDDLTKVKQ